MASKITGLNFKNCKNLKKIYISPDCEVEGKINLVNTSIKDKGKVDEYDTGGEEGFIYTSEKIFQQVKLGGEKKAEEPPRNWEEAIKELEQLRKERDDKTTEQQEQLKKINLLWDPNAGSYAKIDFNGLYNLVQQKATEEKNLKTQINNKDNQITNLQNQLSTLQDGNKNLTDNHRTLTTNLDQLVKERDGLQSNIGNLNNQINDIVKQRDSRPNITLDQWNNDYSKRPTLQQLNNLNFQVSNLTTNYNNSCAQVASLTTQITNLNNQIESLKQKAKDEYDRGYNDGRGIWT